MTRSRRRNASPRAYQSQHERIEALEKSRDHWRRRARKLERRRAEIDSRLAQQQQDMAERFRRAREAEQKPTICGPSWTDTVRIDPWPMLGSVTYSQPDCPHCHDSEQSALWWRRVAGWSVAACCLILAAAAVIW